MKSERRRNIRVAVQMPVVMRSSEAGGNMKVTTLDLSEGGMAVSVPSQNRPRGTWQIAFTLPGEPSALEIQQSSRGKVRRSKLAYVSYRLHRKPRINCANG